MENTNRESEKEIILQLHEGNERAFEHLYEKYAPGLKAFCVRFGFTGYESDDIIQESFRKIWEGRDKVNPQLPFNTYLITIAKHIVYNQLRHQLQVKKYRTELLSPGSSEDSSLPDFKLQKLIEEAIEELPDKCRSVYRKSRVKGLSNAEIADEMNISKSTVENQINKALNKLRSVLRRSGYANFLKSLLFIL